MSNDDQVQDLDEIEDNQEPLLCTTIATELAPAAIGPYSQAVRLGDVVFTSGQIPLDPESGEIVGQTTAEQTEQALKNLEAVLEAAGSQLTHTIKTTCYLMDMGDFSQFNEVYAKFFKEFSPARSAVQVAALPKGVRVEIEAIAYI